MVERLPDLSRHPYLERRKLELLFEQRAQARRYAFKRKLRDPMYAVILAQRSRVRTALKGNPKAYSLWGLVGCTVQELRQHLQQQFKTGMTWENYGKWHVDHIRPCASFNLAEPTEQWRCLPLHEPAAIVGC